MTLVMTHTVCYLDKNEKVFEKRPNLKPSQGIIKVKHTFSSHTVLPLFFKIFVVSFTHDAFSLFTALDFTL